MKTKNSIQQFKQNKNFAAVLYVLSKLGETDFHQIFKMLYFADKKHLAEYGRTITQDNYIAMERGPVPSLIYDNLKNIRNNTNIEFSDLFSVQGIHVKALCKPDLDFLSNSDIECLDIIINECASLSFVERTIKSHDFAWNKTGLNREMSLVNIAIASEANEEMINYINWSNENSL